jgi:hypothetical protein
MLIALTYIHSRCTWLPPSPYQYTAISSQAQQKSTGHSQPALFHVPQRRIELSNNPQIKAVGARRLSIAHLLARDNKKTPRTANLSVFCVPPTTKGTFMLYVDYCAYRQICQETARGPDRGLVRASCCILTHRLLYVLTVLSVAPITGADAYRYPPFDKQRYFLGSGARIVHLSNIISSLLMWYHATIIADLSTGG